jgi:hypothetical protein
VPRIAGPDVGCFPLMNNTLSFTSTLTASG